MRAVQPSELKVGVSLTTSFSRSIPAAEVGRTQPAQALALEEESGEKLKSIGVKIVAEVDKSGFVEKAEPLQDQLAQELGPQAVEIVQIIRGIE